MPSHGHRPGLPAALTALWWAGKDDWSKAHDIVMHAGGPECAWVHAYLHSIEGDGENAHYWYRQAHKRPANSPHEAEWAMIAEALLTGQSR